jgi:hypothetical protein
MRELEYTAETGGTSSRASTADMGLYGDDDDDDGDGN